jgi:hypothetical protein
VSAHVLRAVTLIYVVRSAWRREVFGDERSQIEAGLAMRGAIRVHDRIRRGLRNGVGKRLAVGEDAGKLHSAE